MTLIAKIGTLHAVTLFQHSHVQGLQDGFLQRRKSIQKNPSDRITDYKEWVEIAKNQSKFFGMTKRECYQKALELIEKDKLNWNSVRYALRYVGSEAAHKDERKEFEAAALVGLGDTLSEGEKVVKINKKKLLISLIMLYLNSNLLS